MYIEFNIRIGFIVKKLTSIKNTMFFRYISIQL